MEKATSKAAATVGPLGCHGTWSSCGTAGAAWERQQPGGLSNVKPSHVRAVQIASFEPSQTQCQELLRFHNIGALKNPFGDVLRLRAFNLVKTYISRSVAFEFPLTSQDDFSPPSLALWLKCGVKEHPGWRGPSLQVRDLVSWCRWDIPSSLPSVHNKFSFEKNHHWIKLRESSIHPILLYSRSEKLLLPLFFDVATEVSGTRHGAAAISRRHRVRSCRASRLLLRKSFYEVIQRP